MDDAKRRAAAIYDAAADFFDDEALGFWDRFGRATVDRLGLTSGAAVLDVCAGSGASALPAAVEVGPAGRVVAVDLSENLLALARDKARRLGLSNLVTRHDDLEALDYPDHAFDAVVIVLGIFFLPDRTAATAELWRMVRPGGQLAVTTWGPHLFEPANSLFWDAVAAVRPELRHGYNPWDSLTDPDDVRDLLRDAGVTDPHVEPVSATQQLRAPNDFWKIVLGSGYRATHDAMTSQEQRIVRERTLDALSARDITTIETNVIYAIATKPRPVTGEYPRPW